jgi:S-formylglutathione hydrolase FrmB
MTARIGKRPRALLLLSIIGILCRCGQRNGHSFRDNPQLVPGVTLQDVSFRSAALNREMQYRVILPEATASDQKLPVVYLLHGGGGGFRDWSNYSDVAKYAQKGVILVMPEGNSSYYTNSATVRADRYEDYIVKDLVADVEAHFPAASNRDKRIIAGVSMGGYGAIKIALKHPQLFSFAGGMSPAVDVPTRPFSMKRMAQWRFHSAIFGPSAAKRGEKTIPTNSRVRLNHS